MRCPLAYPCSRSMVYELFDSKAAKLDSPQLTIRNQKIVFNIGASDILRKAGVKLVLILWDVGEVRVAIRPIAKQEGTTFKISTPRGKRSGLISAQSFLNYIQWRATAPVTVDAHWNKAEQLLEASLPREHIGTAVKGPRARAT